MRPVMGLVGPRARAWRKPLRDWTHHDFLRAGAELQPSSPPVRVRFQNAAGSLLTTAVDYARFLALMCDRRSPAPWELPPSLRRLMVTPAVSVQDEGGLSWSLGWAIEHSRGRRYYVHEGNNDNAFTSCAIGDPVAGRGLVILTNAGSGSALARRLVEETTGISPLVFIAHLDPRRSG
jgi:CubicO group peptidase (beta-lactamase class C family)